MDTLDTISQTAVPISDPPGHPAKDLSHDAEVAAEEAVDEVVENARKINWWKVAAYTAAGLAAAGAVGGYVAYRNRQKKPASRLARLRDRLGLADVNFGDLRATYRRVDLGKLNQTRRDLGTYAKAATHQGAKKVAEWTR